MPAPTNLPRQRPQSFEFLPQTYQYCQLSSTLTNPLPEVPRRYLTVLSGGKVLPDNPIMKAKNTRTPRTFAGVPLPRTLGELRRERAVLEEEVLQLRAAVLIWKDVSRQTFASLRPGEAEGAER